MSLFTQLLADSRAIKQYLCIIEPVNPATGLVETYYFSTGQLGGFATAATDSPPSTLFKARMVGPPAFRRSAFSGSLLGGPLEVSYGQLRLKNDTAGTLDFLRTYGLDTRRIRVYLGGTLSNGTVLAYGDYGLIFDGTAAGDAQVGLAEVRINLRGNEFKFEQAALPNVYRGMSHCLAWDGVNDTANGSTHTSQDACSIELWMRCDGNNAAANTQILIEHGTAHAAATLDWYIQISTAGVLSAIAHRTQASPTTIAMSGVDVRDGKFHHVALTLVSGANGMKLYWDGALVGQATPPTFASIATATLAWGSGIGGGGSYFSGRIDEIRFWKKTLTATDVLANMNRELATPVAADMFGYWKLNDNTGSAPVDSSGNGKTGALGAATAAPTWSSSLSGDVNIAGQKIPVGLGAVNDFEAVLVDPQRLIYQFTDGHGTGVPAIRVRAVKDKAATLTLGVGYTVDLTRGLITLLANPAGTITVDFDGASTFNGALQLDGSTGYVNATPTCPANSMTLEVLAKPSAAIPTQQNLCGFRNGAGAAGVRHLMIGTFAADTPCFQVRNDANVAFSVSAGSSTSTSWPHLAGVLDTTAATISLYVNGTLAGSTPVTGTFTTVLSNFDIGRAGGSAANFFAGAVDEVRTWSTARTAQQILDNCSKALVGNETGLVQLWQFEQRSGTSVTNSVAGGATGTTNGTVTWVPSRQSPWDLARWLTVWRGATSDPSGLVLSSFATANATFSWASGWMIKDDDSTIAQVLSEVLDPMGARHGFTRNGLWQAFYLAAPSGTAVDAFNTAQIFSLEPLAFDVPVSQVRVGYQRNWTPQSATDVAGIVASNPTGFAYATNEWRYAVAEDPSVKTTYPNARSIELLTPLANFADAQAYANQELAKMKVRRDAYRAVLKVQPLARDVNDVVTLTYSLNGVGRLGLSTGRDFRALSLEELGQPGKVAAEVFA